MDSQDSMVAPPGITFAPATSDDVPMVLQVFQAAHRPDLFNYLMMLNKTQEEMDQRHERMAKIFENYIPNPNIDLVKAVNESGQLVAFSSWERRSLKSIEESSGAKAVEASDGKFASQVS